MGNFNEFIMVRTGGAAVGAITGTSGGGLPLAPQHAPSFWCILPHIFVEEAGLVGVKPSPLADYFSFALVSLMFSLNNGEGLVSARVVSLSRVALRWLTQSLYTLAKLVTPGVSHDFSPDKIGEVQIPVVAFLSLLKY